SVYDLLGKECAVLLDTEHGSSGFLQLDANQYRLPPGIYFVCLSSNGASCIKRMVIAR
ncbi:MAG: T9SS type A sorting domain-containing protein, partial [Saprospiraceae bacterium]|nr:T9SS type A sorting domain-containing protein [Saprospiraceae bacterium]